MTIICTCPPKTGLNRPNRSVLRFKRPPELFIIMRNKRPAYADAEALPIGDDLYVLQLLFLNRKFNAEEQATVEVGLFRH